MALTENRAVVMAVSGAGRAVARRVADALGVPLHGRAGRVAGYG